MKQFVASLASVAPYFQSRNYDMDERRPAKESADEFEKRTWRLRTHVDDDGQIIIPAEAIQAAIRDGAAYLSEKIPGRGSEKWTKHFAAGRAVRRGWSGMIAAQTLPAGRKIERKELISIFVSLAPGAEILFEEIAASIGIDPAKSGDRNLIYAVREHCRDVLGIVIEAVPGRGYRRATDDDVSGRIVERRRDRIYRQSVRGAAESVAVQDFAALDRGQQLRLLANQSVFGAIALASCEATTRQIERDIGSRPMLDSSPGDVIRAIAAIEQ